MGANRVGQLYRHSGELAIWPSPSTYDHPAIGATRPGEPILILERLTDGFRERWVHVLVGGRVGWIKAEYINLEWIDPEEEK